MKKPKFVYFDYGHTLVLEDNIDPLRGYRAVLDHAVKNPDHVTAKDIKEMYDTWRTPMVRAVVDAEYETVSTQYDRAVYDALGLEFDCDPQTLEEIAWDAMLPESAMPHVGEMLNELHEMGIKTAVLSNLSYTEASLKHRILRVIPDANMEFYIASSTYGFRKPFGILFQIALRKAGYAPDEIFFCGDNTRADVFGAHQCGMTPVWYNPPIPCFYRPKSLDVKPDFFHYEVNDWLELPELIRSL